MFIFQEIQEFVPILISPSQGSPSFDDSNPLAPILFIIFDHCLTPLFSFPSSFSSLPQIIFSFFFSATVFYPHPPNPNLLGIWFALCIFFKKKKIPPSFHHVLSNPAPRPHCHHHQCPAAKQYYKH